MRNTRPRSRSQTPAFLLVLLIMLATMAALAPDAGAHAIVAGTEPGIDEVVPQPPHRVVMRFNEPVELEFGALKVFDTKGNRVDEGEADHLSGKPDAIAVALQPDLPDGTYTVAWRVTSADSHVIQEAFVFHVGEPGARPEGIAAKILAGEAGAGRLEGLLFGITRGVNFAALLALGGAVSFLAWAWGASNSTLAHRSPEVEADFFRRWRILTRASWFTALIATIAAFVLQGAVAGDMPLGEALSPDVLVDVVGTRFGRVSVFKFAVLLVLAGLWITAARRRALPAARPLPAGRTSLGAAALQPGVPRWLIAAGGLAVAALLLTPGLAGHAGTTDPVIVNLITDFGHVAGAAVWVGGLAMLLLVAFPATRTLAPPDRLAVMGPVVSRFSNAAVVAVAVIVATGIYRSWIEVRALRGLVDATYGQVLLVKVAAFLPLLALGAINNRITKPRIERALAAGKSSTQSLDRLRKLVGLEAAIALVVIALTAFLVNLPPARVTAGVEGPFMKDIALGEHTYNLLVEPNQVGRNEIHIAPTNSTINMMPDIKEMKVLLRMPEQDIGPLVAKAETMGHGFIVSGHQLSVPGDWTLEIVARIDRFEELRTEVTVPVNP
jgi:copper transport protein